MLVHSVQDHKPITLLVMHTPPPQQFDTEKSKLGVRNVVRCAIVEIYAAMGLISF